MRQLVESTQIQGQKEDPKRILPGYLVASNLETHIQLDPDSK